VHSNAEHVLQSVHSNAEHVLQSVHSNAEHALQSVHSNAEHVLQSVHSNAEHALQSVHSNAEHALQSVHSNGEHVLQSVHTNAEHVLSKFLQITFVLTKPTLRKIMTHSGILYCLNLLYKFQSYLTTVLNIPSILTTSDGTILPPEVITKWSQCKGL